MPLQCNYRRAGSGSIKSCQAAHIPQCPPREQGAIFYLVSRLYSCEKQDREALKKYLNDMTFPLILVCFKDLSKQQVMPGCLLCWG